MNMRNFFEITYDDINNLNDENLTELLKDLLYLEAKRFNIPLNGIGCSLKINVSDAGEDAHVKWENGCSKTNWFPNRYTLFQCKATDMAPKNCYNEILNEDGTKLKELVEDVLENKGTYILFCNKTYNEKQIKNRIENFRKALKTLGKQYSETASFEIYDANKIAQWVNQYLPLQISVGKETGKSISFKVLSWEQWSKYDDLKNEFFSDKTIEEMMIEIKEKLKNSKSCVRIVGWSGIGKTRLILETFRPQKDDVNSQILSKNVVYINAAIVESTEILGWVSQWKTLKYDNIIIVDNCDLKLHKSLKNEMRHEDSSLKLLTLDYALEKDSDTVEVPFPSPDIIKKIIKREYLNIQDIDIDRIVDFSEKFPQIAVMLAKSRLENDYDMGNLRDDDLLYKLLWGRRNTANEEAQEAIRACSLFDHVGFEDDVVEQRKYIAEKICDMKSDKFYEYITEFMERGIIDRRHRFIRVVPRPLAIRLAADWLKKSPPEKIKNLLMSTMPDGMKESLCEQFKKLHFVPIAQEIVKDLCGDNAPFGQAEVLNSEIGSMIFRSLVEINPTDAAKCIYKVYNQMPIDEIKKVQVSRRNLVWSLENLCFWKSSFDLSAKIMLKFAVAENENWSNNATGQFLQLFHYTLSGTQADLSQRISIIDYALQMKDEEFVILATKALGSALCTHGMIKTVGPEIQGSGFAQEEWKPKNWGEVFDYWNECLRRLVQIAKSKNNEIAELAEKEILSNVRGLLSLGRIREIENSIEEILNNRKEYWIEAFHKLQEVKAYDYEKFPQEGKLIIDKLINLLDAHDVRGKLINKISRASYNSKNIDGNYINFAEKDAIDLACCLKNSISEVINNLDVLLLGEQRMSYVFGKKLGETNQNPVEFLKNCTEFINNQDISQVNISLVSGFLVGIQASNQYVIDKTLDEFKENKKLSTFLIDITTCLKVSKKDIERILGIINNNSVQDLRKLRYCSLIEILPEKDLMWLCDKLLDMEGGWILLDILCFQTEIDTVKYKDLLEKTMLKLDISESSRNYSMDGFYFEKVTLSLLKIEKNYDFAENISDKIFKKAQENKLNDSLVTNIQEIEKCLFKDYQDISWNILKKCLVDVKVSSIYFDLIRILRVNNYSNNSFKGLIEEISDERIEVWFKEYSDKAPYIFTLLVPVIKLQNQQYVLNPVLNKVIDKYGDDEKVLRGIGLNLGSFSWSGSLIPLYQKHLLIFKTLRSHKLENVRLWSEKQISALNNKIGYEMQREEERKITGDYFN